jgi:hypothetical protein
MNSKSAHWMLPMPSPVSTTCSIAIANPAPRDRLEKCSSIDDSHFHQHGIEHVSHKFPKAGDYLLNRLKKANFKRRQLLQYYEQYHDRAAGTSHRHEQEGLHDLDSETLVNTAIQTNTTTSTYVLAEGTMDCAPDYNPDFKAYTETSFASSIRNSDRLRVPPPPNQESAFEGIAFECPYCFSLIKVDG